MMYTRERLIKAVREAGHDGRQFTLGEVRAELGIKSRDKREQKRFRSRFRECSQVLGDNLERLGPNTFRLTAAYLAANTLKFSPSSGKLLSTIAANMATNVADLAAARAMVEGWDASGSLL